MNDPPPKGEELARGSGRRATANVASQDPASTLGHGQA
jgi:hypothetical protein